MLRPSRLAPRELPAAGIWLSEHLAGAHQREWPARGPRQRRLLLLSGNDMEWKQALREAMERFDVACILEDWPAGARLQTSAGNGIVGKGLRCQTVG